MTQQTKRIFKINNKNINITNQKDVLLRRSKQAGSTIFLLAAVLSLPDTVCPYYRTGCHVNLIVSILFHGAQEPAYPKRPHLTRLPTTPIPYEFSCSKILSDHRRDHWIVSCIDKAAVCFICLYTGVDGLYHPALVATLCLLAGFMHKMNELLVIYALYLTMDELDSLSMTMQVVFWMAAVIGVFVFVFMDYIGAWCTPYRYFWHLCCGCFVAIGGLLN